MGEWTVLKAAYALRPGDRFIFSDNLGGEGEVLTVESIANSFGTIEVATEELDFTLDVGDKTMVTMSLEGGDDDYLPDGHPVEQLRVFDEGDGWVIDGANAAGDKWTTDLFKYDTKDEALSHAEEFKQFLREQGYTLADSLPVKEEW